MTNAQSMWALRNEIKKLKRMLKDSNQKNLDQEDTMNQMQAFLSEKTAEYGHLMMIKTNKIKNLENLVGVCEKRLARMAERLTSLADERNQYHAGMKDLIRELDLVTTRCKEYERKYKALELGVEP